MDSKNDKEYLIAIKTEYNLLEKKFIKTEEDLKKWENRANLAKQAGKVRLKIEAKEQTEIIRNNIKYLSDQLFDIKQEVEKAVKSIQTQPQQLSIDPNKLLKEMNTLIGDKQLLDFEKELTTIKINSELERLKRQQ